jgi:putative endonuclease
LEANHTRSSASQREAAIKAMTAQSKRLLIDQSQAQTLAHIVRYQLQGLHPASPVDPY